MRLAMLLLFIHSVLFSIAEIPPGSAREARRINILVSSKTGKFDIITLSVRVRAKMNALFSRGRLHVISASSSKDLAKKGSRLLNKKQAMVGNLWFDSHGHLARRYSLIEVGKDEFNYKNINDSAATRWLGMLAPFTDTLTTVGLGSCYSGATYATPSMERFAARSMNGDSLMMGMSRVFQNASVYGSESWVMSGPGIFSSTYALSGYPPRKKFQDPFFRPVWERIGIWNIYNGQSKTLRQINTVCLDRCGDIGVQQEPYLDRRGKKKKQLKKLDKLKPGNYNLAFMFQFN